MDQKINEIPYEYDIKIIDAFGKVRNDRKGVVLEIKYRGQLFRFMPTYKDLAKMYELLAEVEEWNKSL